MPLTYKEYNGILEQTVMFVLVIDKMKYLRVHYHFRFGKDWTIVIWR